MAVVGRSPAAPAVALRSCLGNKFAKRALLFALGRRPEKTILFSRLTDDALRVCVDAGSGPVLLGVFVLGIDVGKTGLDCIQLILPDPPAQHRRRPRGRV